MNSIFKQDDRLGRLVTTIGADKLVLLRFTGSDQMSDLFEYKVEALSTEPNVDFDTLVGTHASVELQTRQHGPRWFDGIVTNVSWLGTGENGNRYNLTLRPWAYIASKRRNQKIFHNKTVVDIISEVFQSYASLGNPAFEDKLTKSYPKLEYTVQYRESDLDFVARLMQRFGISYFFSHVEGSHTLVLCDCVDDNPRLAGKSREYIGLDGHHHSDEEHFWHWAPERNLTTGAIRLTDFNFKKPTSAMEVERAGDAKYAQGLIESFDYPGDYLVEGEGKGVAELRTNQERGQDHKHSAIGDCISLGSGMKVALTGEALPGVHSKEFLCLKATHNYVSDSYGSGGDEEDTLAFTGKYELAPVEAPMVSQRQGEVPMVHGPQTAMVVGDGEIDCDEHGRILVHFHWDLEKAYSMRCRVSQNWSGGGWGGMVIPRIGMEVVVEFLEGDPDKPLVTGCVYNGKNKPPYELPAHKTRSTFKTDSSVGDGFNELRFEDKAGEEEVYFRAEKDYSQRVRDNSVSNIGGLSVENVDKDRWEFVGHTNSLKIAKDYNIDVGFERNSGGAFGHLNLGDDNLQDRVFGYDAMDYDVGSTGDFRMTVKGTIRMTTHSTYNLDATDSVRIDTDESATLTAEKDVDFNAGKHLDMTAGKSFIGAAGTFVKFEVAGNSITLSKDGRIRIRAKSIELDADQNIDIRAGRKINLKAPKIDMN